MRSKPWVLGSLAALSLMALVGTAAAVNFASDQEPAPAVRDDPTERDSARKEEEASRPTPTPVPPIDRCPVDDAVCEFGQLLGAALADGDAALLERSRPTAVDCDIAPSSPALAPQCAAGGLQEGFFTGVFAKSFGFVDADGFARFISEALSNRSDSPPDLVAIGCAAEETSLDCGQFSAFSYRVSPEGNVLVIVARENDSGTLEVIGAHSWASTTAAVQGGEQSFGQHGLPYTGPVRFIPVALD
jgi:hypothetical protein